MPKQQQEQHSLGSDEHKKCLGCKNVLTVSNRRANKGKEVMRWWECNLSLSLIIDPNFSVKVMQVAIVKNNSFRKLLLYWALTAAATATAGTLGVPVMPSQRWHCIPARCSPKWKSEHPLGPAEVTTRVISWFLLNQAGLFLLCFSRWYLCPSAKETDFNTGPVNTHLGSHCEKFAK